MLPKIGVSIELKNGTQVTVIQQNPNGYDPEKPQEFVGEDADGERHILQSKDLHPRYFK
ncbi:hypothetical protein [Metabacillus sp. SLBN-84]